MIENIEKVINEKKILSGKVIVAKRSKLGNKGFVILDCDGTKVKIYNDEVEKLRSINSINDLLGTEMPFIVTGSNENYVLGSNKQANYILTIDVREKIESGEVMQGIIINIIKAGAYINVDGVVVFLKNTDFSLDCTICLDVLRIGDLIEVKFIRKSSNGTIMVEAVNKHQSGNLIKFEDLYEKADYVAVIMASKPFGYFVSVGPTQVLCSTDKKIIFEEGDKCIIRITKIDPETKRCRGRILKKYEM